jgi:hypothetical protein
VVLRRYNRVNWKLLLVDLAKIQYTRDGKGPDLRTYDFMFDSRWKQVILASLIQDKRMKQKSCLISNVQNISEIGLSFYVTQSRNKLVPDPISNPEP